MAFELRGFPILSYGELMDLVKSTREGSIVPPPIAAWFHGERVSPRSLQLGLHKLATQVETDEGHEILARAARRMNEALGRDEFCLDEYPPAEPGEWDGGL